MCTLQQKQIQKLTNTNFEYIQMNNIYNIKFLGLMVDNIISLEETN